MGGLERRLCQGTVNVTLALPSRQLAPNKKDTMTTETTIASNEIPFNSIVIPEGFNVRVEDSEVAELAANITKHGLMNPLVVEYRATTDGDVPYLVSGFRRALALKKLRWGNKPVRVTVKRFEHTLDAYIFNIDENVHREDIHPLDLGRRLGDLAEGTYPVRDGEEAKAIDKKQLQKMWDFQKSHVNNLIRLSKKLAPEIQAFWRKNWSPSKKEQCFSLTQALEWCGISLEKREGESAEDLQRRAWDEQIKHFEKWKAGGIKKKSSADKEEAKDKEDKSERVKTRSAAQIREKVEELQAEAERLRTNMEALSEGGKRNEIAWHRYVAEQKKIALEWALGEREVLTSAKRPA